MSRTDDDPHTSQDPSDVVGVDPASIRRGHEEDVADVRMIWTIPLAVVGFIALGIAVAAVMFYYFSKPEADPSAHPLARDRNAASLNERLGRLGRAGQSTTEPSDQPRLEGLRQRADDGQTTSRPAGSPGNSPEYHPEDLRTSLQPALQKGGWVEQGKVARIPIDDAMKLAVEGKLFPISKDAAKPLDSGHLPTAANAGRGGIEEPKHEKPKEKEKEKDKKDH